MSKQPQPYTREFEVFWKKYPKRGGKKRKKRPAFLMWLRLTDDEQHEVLTKVKFIRQFEGDYPRDAVTWLNPETQRGWEDIEFKPDYVPVLPEELTVNILKMDEHKSVNINNERNRQTAGLSLRKGR